MRRNYGQPGIDARLIGWLLTSAKHLDARNERCAAAQFRVMTESEPHEQVRDLPARLQTALGESYSVERVLGSGGFARVFLVRDLRLKRSLAVKVLSPELVASPILRERFHREAETIAQLAHPNIVPLHFIGESEDLFYLAMACVDGGSIADRIAMTGPLPVDEAARILSEVATALAHAHKRGVVHRDIKPQNVLVDTDTGRAMVTDFGIARTAGQAPLTSGGIVVGTPTYLAPEQVFGGDVDHRVDIYALGVMAYEILTNSRPFENVTRRLAGRPEPVSSRRSEVPPWLDAIVMRCLAADPDDRFQSAAEIVESLQTREISATESVSERAPRSHRTTFAIAAAALAMFVLIFAFSHRSASVATVAAAVPAVDSDMALIPAGDYQIGMDAGPPAAFYRPEHTVHLAAFGIDKHEVTVAEYETYRTATRAATPWTERTADDSTLPVRRVTYAEAEAYCAWRHGGGGRLPTEEEWEASARGLGGRHYPWGSDARAGFANIASAKLSGPAAIGRFRFGATPEGVENLVGNVWEWTRSVLQAYPGGPAIAAPAVDSRVIRGGAFNTPDSLATPWFRAPYPISASRDELEYTGFRCAMVAR